MSYLPCQNPSCNSYGKPHPNCRCHGGLAAGGEAGPYCAQDRAHEDNCEYFANGGDVGEEVPADDLPEVSTEPMGDAVPPEDMPEGHAAAPVEGIGEAVPPEDLPDNSELSPADLQKKMYDRAHPDGPGKYDTPGQMLAAGAEGAAQGLGSFVAPWAERDLLGVPEEDIAGRAAAHPIAHGVGELAGLVAGTALPIGQGALFAGSAAKVARGSAFLKGAIEGGLLFGSDKASQALLGQGNPADAVNPYLAGGANLLFSGALGSLGSKAAGGATELIEKQGMKAAAYAENYLAKMGDAAESGELNKKVAKIIGGELGAKTIGAYAGVKMGEKFLSPLISKFTARPTKYVGETVARWLTNGLQGSVFNMIDYANKVARGESLINNSLDMLFKGAGEKAVGGAVAGTEKLREYLDGGGHDQDVQQSIYDQNAQPPGMAEGGEVKASKTGIHHDDHIAQNFPDQNLMLQAARGRISQYLNSQKPQKNAPKLAYDRDADDRQAKKAYNKALDIAVDPLSIMNHIKKGTITTEHMQHFNGMYPELGEHLRQKVTERVTHDQVDGKKPPYAVRQGLSLFLGTPLSGELTPQAIQAAQGVFASAKQAQQQQPAPPKQKKGTAMLSKSSQAFLSDDQARERRQQKV